MSGRPTFACVCTSCGWKSKRALKNVSRACPKCGGPVVIPPGEDRETAIIVVVISTILMIGFAILIASLES